jgi:hypothetical protein
MSTPLASGSPRQIDDPATINDPATITLAVLRACPIDFVNGLLPAGAPDASAINRCYGDMLITLASPDPPGGWVLTDKGEGQLAEGGQ